MIISKELSGLFEISPSYPVSTLRDSSVGWQHTQGYWLYAASSHHLVAMARTVKSSSKAM